MPLVSSLRTVSLERLPVSRSGILDPLPLIIGKRFYVVCVQILLPSPGSESGLGTSLEPGIWIPDQARPMPTKSLSAWHFPCKLTPAGS